MIIFLNYLQNFPYVGGLFLMLKCNQQPVTGIQYSVFSIRYLNLNFEP